MTLTLELTAELEQKIRAQAKCAGLDEAQYIQHLIEVAPDEPNMTDATPAETVAYWLRDSYPVFDGLPDSPELARKLRRTTAAGE